MFTEKAFSLLPRIQQIITERVISSTIGPDCANIDHSPPYDDFATLSSDRLYRDDIKKSMLTEVWESASKFKFPFR